MFIDKLEKLQHQLIENNLDAFVIIPGSNFRYLTGGDFHLMERPTALIISKNQKPLAILPVLEVDSFRKLNIDAEIFQWQDSDGYQDAFNKAFEKIKNCKSLGVEGQRMRVFEYEAIKNANKDLNISNAQRIISNIRLRKNSDDVENLQKAIKIAETTLANTINYVEIGKSEIEIKNFLLQQLYENGAEGIAFDPIVLAGANSALPHGHSSNDYFLKDGDCLLFDFGAVVNGYNSDITRTFFVGSASDEQKNFYDAVLKANKLGLSISKPNLTMHNLDDSVLNSLEDSGYKDYIVHKTGHGLGLDVHEDPYIMRKNNELLEEGMIITIEPGLYKQGDLGVRIEDDVLITNDGCKSLTTFSKELRII